MTDNTEYYEANGYRFFGGHTFKVYNYPLTWKNAKTACEIMGGHLATSTTAEKNDFLTSMTIKITWLGATDEASEGVWKWVTGEAWSYTNWNVPQQPDNAGKNEHYLCLNYGGSGLWNDYTPTITFGFICEWDFDIRTLPVSETLRFLNTNGYKFYDGHTFKYVSTLNTWPEAKVICEAIGGHLATSTSAEKNVFLTTLTTAYAWLGGTDEEVEGTWKWVTGETWSYTNWRAGQPDNYQGIQHYLVLNYNSKEIWDDDSATTPHGYICEWDFDIRPSMLRNHEASNNLQGGGVGEHYHLTEYELSKLQKILDKLYPDGAEEPVFPIAPVTPTEPSEPSGTDGKIFAGLPSLTPPQWTSVRLPNYSTRVQYSCYNAVHSMYYGISAAKKGTTPQTRLHVLLEYGNTTNCYLVSTPDLNTWTAEHTFNKKSEAGHGISQYMYINTGNTSSIYQHRLYVMLPGRTSTSNMIRFLYGEQTSGKCSEWYISQANVGSKTPYVACCYSAKHKMYIFVSRDGHVARADASSTKNHKVLTKEKTNNCCMSVNAGCAAWSSYANVFCVSGPNGTATSSDGKGSWTTHTNAPKNLVDLVYREDIPGEQPKGFFARSATNKCFYASADGANWLKVNTAPIPLATVSAVAYAPSLGWYCAIGGRSKYAFFSKDLTSWVSSRVSNTDIDMGSVIWMPNVQKFVLMPKSGTEFYTFAPADWSE